MLFSLPSSRQADISEREFRVLFPLALLTILHLHCFPGQPEALLLKARAKSCGTTARGSRTGQGRPGNIAVIVKVRERGMGMLEGRRGELVQLS